MNTINLHAWPTVSEAAVISGYTPDHIRLLARTGQIRAKMIDGRWRINRKDAEKRGKTVASTGRPRKYQNNC